jgi:hypothetical protein
MSEGKTMSAHADLLPRYKQLREVGRPLNSELFKSLPKDVLDEAGQKLGVLRNNVFVLDSEEEMGALMDFAIHDVRRQGRNAVERRLAERPPPPDSDEMAYLLGLRDAHFALLIIESTEPGVGVWAYDAIRGERHFLTDIGLGSTSAPDYVVAARIMNVGGITMTTGAPFLVGGVPEQGREEFIRAMAALNTDEDGAPLSSEGTSKRNARIIVSGMKKRAAAEGRARVAGHSRLPSTLVEERSGGAVGRRDQVGRNDLCPCGSGKKFKGCCMRRR